MNKVFSLLLIIIILVIGAYFLFIKDSSELSNKIVDSDTKTITSTTTEMVKVEDEENNGQSVIGVSVGGHNIIAYHFGSGEKNLLFIGGIHGGYSWNTVLVAYELMDYLNENPSIIPENVEVSIIPVMNPDGLYKVVGSVERFSKADIPKLRADTIPGRFNGNEVDLNRNFDCDWQASGKWQNKTVSGGDEPFSEPEAQALRNYIEEDKPDAVIVWYSAAGGVFASECHNGIAPDTLSITNLYAEASGYKAFNDFDFYSITGDMVNWIAKNNISAISVLLKTHDDIEFEENLAGIEALFKFYAE